MRKLIDFFIERSLIVNLFTVMVILIGSISLYLLKKETFPQIDFDVIVISTPYPGSSAEDVEKLVTIPIERKLKGIGGIKKTNALSTENSSIIYLEVEADNDLDEVLTDVKNEVDTVNDLPEDVDVPIIRSINNKLRGVMKITLTGGTYNELRFMAKKLRDKLEVLPGIADISLPGYQVDEIRVELDVDKLDKYEVTVSDVFNALRQRNLNLSSGSIKSSSGDIFVRTQAEFENLDEIREVVVRSNTSGSRVKVSDIGNVIRQPAEGTTLQRADGERAVFLDIKIQENADILSSTELIKQKNEQFFKNDNFNKFTYKYTDDSSYYVKRRLNILKDNGFIGIGLVFICLMFFLNFRTSLVTSLGAPIAFMTAFIVMGMTGVSVNLISMFALILVLGMLVDDAIIVSEQFYQKLEQGIEPKEAARQASYETIKPVTTTILTTIVAFGSLFFMGGIMGKFLWSVPAVVIICLLASLFECYFILPSHLADFCKLSDNHKGRRWYDTLTDYYLVVLKKFIKIPWLVLISFTLILLGSMVLAAKKMDFELFPGDDVRVVYIQMKGKVGTPFDLTNEAVRKLEEIAIKEVKKEELDQIRSQVGVLIGDQGNKTGDHYGSVIVYLTPPGDRNRSTDDIIEAIVDPAKKVVPNFVVTVKKQQGGPPKGKPVDIELTADDLDTLRMVAKRVDSELSKVAGVTSTEIDFEEGKKQFLVNVDDEEARRLGLSTSQIAQELRRFLSGDAITEIRESDEDIEIKIYPIEEQRGELDTLKKLYINNNQNRLIPISKVVSFEEVPGAFVIRRQDRKRIISVSASLDKAKATPVSVVKEMKPIIEKIIKDFPDVAYVFGGENKDTQESMMRLGKSALISLSCIFLILVFLFNNLRHPAVVMSAIPLGLIGVIWAFFIANQALGFMAMMGVVGLVGVVVNDSIVLVNFINVKREEVEDLPEAVMAAAKSRFRAVILTTFTTVAGLLPIAHPTVSKVLSFGFNNDSDPFLQPMALSFAWGLMFASMVTLIFIPCNYIVFERIKLTLKKISKKFKREEVI